MADLEMLHQDIRGCVACALHQGRTQAVPGEGSPNARLMFVGEGPGFNEDIQGRPFIGAAGRFLDQLLERIGLDRDTVYITNMVKCRPPNNRDPFPGELAACSGFLEKQIQLIAPDLIVPLGRHALARWFPNEAIGKVRAMPRWVDGRLIFPLYHPAAALHNDRLRQTIIQDFEKLGDLLKEREATTGSVPFTPVESGHEPILDADSKPSGDRQLPMF